MNEVQCRHPSLHPPRGQVRLRPFSLCRTPKRAVGSCGGAASRTLLILSRRQRGRPRPGAVAPAPPAARQRQRVPFSSPLARVNDPSATQWTGWILQSMVARMQGCGLASTAHASRGARGAADASATRLRPGQPRHLSAHVSGHNGEGAVGRSGRANTRGELLAGRARPSRKREPGSSSGPITRGVVAMISAVDAHPRGPTLTEAPRARVGTGTPPPIPRAACGERRRADSMDGASIFTFQTVSITQLRAGRSSSAASIWILISQSR